MQNLQKKNIGHQLKGHQKCINTSHQNQISTYRKGKTSERESPNLSVWTLEREQSQHFGFETEAKP